MDRRTFLTSSLGTLTSASLLAGLPMATRAFGASGMAMGNDDFTHDSLLPNTPEIQAQLHVVRKAAFACVAAGVACVEHCEEQLIQLERYIKDPGVTKEGSRLYRGKDLLVDLKKDSSFENCSLRVHQMLAVCHMTGTLAGYRAMLLKQVLDACIAACDACAVVCQEHEAHFAMGMHLPCKECMQTCIDCKTACQNLQKLIA